MLATPRRHCHAWQHAATEALLWHSRWLHCAITLISQQRLHASYMYLYASYMYLYGTEWICIKMAGVLNKEWQSKEWQESKKSSNLSKFLGSILLKFCVLDHTLMNRENVLCCVQHMRPATFLHVCTVHEHVRYFYTNVANQCARWTRNTEKLRMPLTINTATTRHLHRPSNTNLSRYQHAIGTDSPVLKQSEAFMCPDPNQPFNGECFQGLQSLCNSSHPACHLSWTVDVVWLHVLSEPFLWLGIEVDHWICKLLSILSEAWNHPKHCTIERAIDLSKWHTTGVVNVDNRHMAKEPVDTSRCAQLNQQEDGCTVEC